MEKEPKVKRQNTDKKKPLKPEWFILIGIIILFSCCYLYTDLPFTSAGGLRVLNCIAEGNFPMFYWSYYPGVENSALPYGSAGGDYDFLIYAIYAFYMFPLWIWEKLTDLSFISFYPTRLYLKGSIWLFSALSAFLIYKIALQCGSKKENAIWAPVLFLSSGIFFATEVTIGGYDIISVAFSLLGIYGFLKKNNKCFLISFAIAIATKLFAFWLFVPLLLLREKKIWKLMWNMLLALSAIVVPKLYFAFASKNRMMQELQLLATETGNAAEEVPPMAVNDVIAHSDIINDAIFPTEYTANYTFLSLSNLPLVFVGMFAIWICCYLIKQELTGIETIYLCALVMSVFIATVKIHPYWGILLVPYLSLIVVMNPKHLKENLLLETLISIGYVINKAILYPWCFSMAQIERMAGPNYVFGYDRENTNISRYGLEGLVNKLSGKIGISENNIAHMFSALFVVAIAMFLYLNWPKKIEEEKNYIGEIDGFRKMMMIRFLFSLFVAILPMIGLLMYISPYSWQ